MSIGAARRIARAALAAYPVEVQRLQLWHAGYNDTFRVRTPQGDLGLRVTRAGPSHTHVQSEVTWLRAVADQSPVRVPEVLQTRSGADVVEVDGRVCVLTRWLPGAQRFKGLSPAMLHAVGRTLAQLHIQAEQWQPPADFERPRFAGIWLGMPSPIPHLPTDAQALFTEAAERVEPILDAALAPRNIVIHADVHQANYRFTRGHQVGVIDFDDCGWGTPVQDVAITLYYLQAHPRFESLWTALQAGYSTLRSWPGDRQTIEGLLIWRTLHLCADVLVHPSPRMRALVDQMIPKWTARLHRFMR